jgi:hypothetical protein
MQIRGRVIGGYEPLLKGVALMFDESGPGNCSSCVLDGNNALTISLNAGTNFPATYTSGSGATAARDWDNQLVETSGSDAPTPPVPLTILVKRDTDGPGGTPGCVVPASGPFVEPTPCNASKNQVVSIFGNGEIILAGVQYGPTDNMAVGGNSTANGRVGQIISWTLSYGGGIAINQQGARNEGNGILRIDAACSAPPPTETCTP